MLDAGVMRRFDLRVVSCFEALLMKEQCLTLCSDHADVMMCSMHLSRNYTASTTSHRTAMPCDDS